MPTILPSSTLASYKNQQLGGLLTGAGTGIQSAGSPQLSALVNRASRSPVGLQAGKTQTGVVAGAKRLTAMSQQTAQIVQMKKRRAAAAAAASANAGGGGGGVADSGAGGASNVGLGGAYGMTPQAGAKLNALIAAARGSGIGIGVTEGGRTRARQQQLYNLYKAHKGNLAAAPGHSVHESGLAVDLKLSNAAFNWMRANAARFGYRWTGGTFKQVEQWHWEYHP